MITVGRRTGEGVAGASKHVFLFDLFTAHIVLGSARLYSAQTVGRRIMLNYQEVSLSFDFTSNFDARKTTQTTRPVLFSA